MSTTVGNLLQTKGDDVWTISPRASVYQALELLADKDIGALPVVEAEKLVGIFSERDYARKIILKGRSSQDASVGEMMTSPVVAATSEKTIEFCMALMADKRVRHLPILDDGRLVGIVTVGDIVQQIIAEQGFTIQQLLLPKRMDSSLHAMSELSESNATEPDEFLSFLHAGHIFSLILQEVLEENYLRQVTDTDIPLAQFNLLRLIAYSDNPQACEIAGIMGRSQPAISKNVDKLVRSGLVQRQFRQDDRRAASLVLTDEGKSLVDRYEALREEKLKDVLNSFSLEELHTLSQGLEKASQLMLESLPQAPPTAASRFVDGNK